MSYQPALEIRRRLIGTRSVNLSEHPAIKVARATLNALYVPKQGHVYNVDAVQETCKAFDAAMKQEGLTLKNSAPLR